MQNRRLCRLSLSLLLAITSVSHAASLSADQILEKVRDRPDGDDSYSEAKLILTESNGSTRTRDLIYLTRNASKTEKVTLFFTGPADVKGVALQSFNYDESSGKDDDQWMYLPAFRQVRRISAIDKRGAFMGSQFSYIDIDKLRVSDYTQKLIGEEDVLDHHCYLIERLPVSEKIINKTGYYKIRTWVDKDTFVAVKHSYYDARGVQFKEMTVKKLEKFKDIWLATQTDMHDLVNLRSSTLTFSNVHYNIGLGDVLFQQDIMRTGVNSGNLPALR